MFNPLSSVVRLFGGLFRRPPFEALRPEQSDALATLLWASVHADGEPMFKIKLDDYESRPNTTRIWGSTTCRTRLGLPRSGAERA